MKHPLLPRDGQLLDVDSECLLHLLLQFVAFLVELLSDSFFSLFVELLYVPRRVESRTWPKRREKAML
jgi:hypothetical protein